MRATQTSDRYQYICLLNIAACFCVVVLHCTEAAHTFSATASWWLAMALQSVARWAVPVFFMITGVTLLEYRKKYTTAAFFKKRLLRTGIPFVVWSLIVYLYRLFLSRSLTWAGVWDIVQRVVSNDLQPVYWFFFALFGIYLCIPVVSKLMKRENTRLLWYWVALWFLLSAVEPLARRFLSLTIAPHFSVPLAVGMLGYCILGWLLHNDTPPKKWRVVIYMAGALGALLMPVGTYFLSRGGDGTLDHLLTGYASVCTVPMAAAVFLLFRGMEPRLHPSPRVKRLIDTASAASFGVYLTQMFVIGIVGHLLKPDITSPLYMIGGAVGVYLLCVVGVAICQRIPVLRKLFP